MGVTTMKYGVLVCFCPKLAIFGKTVVDNRSAIWESQPRNTEFRSVSAPNWQFLVNRRLTLMDFEQNSEIFYNLLKFIYGTFMDNRSAI
jgi:hypothetical protein